MSSITHEPYQRLQSAIILFSFLTFSRGLRECKSLNVHAIGHVPFPCTITLFRQSLGISSNVSSLTCTSHTRILSNAPNERQSPGEINQSWPTTVFVCWRTDSWHLSHWKRKKIAPQLFSSLHRQQSCVFERLLPIMANPRGGKSSKQASNQPPRLWLAESENSKSGISKGGRRSCLRVAKKKQ